VLVWVLELVAVVLLLVVIVVASVLGLSLLRCEVQPAGYV